MRQSCKARAAWPSVIAGRDGLGHDLWALTYLPAAPPNCVPYWKRGRLPHVYGGSSHATEADDVAPESGWSGLVGGGLVMGS